LRLGLLLVLPAALCPLLSACSPNKRYDAIEAELRTRNRELLETRAALDQARSLNRAFEQQQQLAAQPHPAAALPTGGVFVRDIQLARGTGGLDEDGAPGDEALMVVVVPRDDDGSAVKVPGRLQVAASEITPQGLKNPIGSWDVSPERLRPTWRSGVLSTGYFVTLPWQTFPTTERVRVVVRLTTIDGRVFEADRDVTVHPVLQAVPRGNAYPTTPVSPSPAPHPDSVLPPPADLVPPVGPRGREPLMPGNPPPGVPPTLPPGVEELPPPMRTSERGARLLPPVKQ
jgi:hypothetical protein